MINDKAMMLSDGQAVTNTAASESYIDQGVAGNAYMGLWCVARVGTAFANATNMAIDLQCDDNDSFSSAKTLLSSGAIVEADLTINKIVYAARVPAGAERYIRGYYTVSGTHNAGNIDLFFTKDLPTV